MLSSRCTSGKPACTFLMREAAREEVVRLRSLGAVGSEDRAGVAHAWVRAQNLLARILRPFKSGGGKLEGSQMIRG